jgi:Sjoegren syndrome nuclear autoantigen 1
MAQQGATLQNYNNELVKCIEDIRDKREQVNRLILKDEEEKAKIQKDLNILTVRLVQETLMVIVRAAYVLLVSQERLTKVNESLAYKVEQRNKFDRTIKETETAYMKILESSQTLLHVLKTQSVSIVSHKERST